jgi:hypothetical protein
MYVRNATFCNYPSTSTVTLLNVTFSAGLVNVADEEPQRV